MIDGQNVFYQPIKVDLRTNHNIRKTAIGQEDGHKTGCLLDYLYFKENYKLIPIDLSQQQARDVNPTAIQQLILKAI